MMHAYNCSMEYGYKKSIPNSYVKATEDKTLINSITILSLIEGTLNKSNNKDV